MCTLAPVSVILGFSSKHALLLGRCKSVATCSFYQFFWFYLAFFSTLCVFFNVGDLPFPPPTPRGAERCPLSRRGLFFFRHGAPDWPQADPKMTLGGGGAPALVLNGSPKTTWAADAPNPFVLSLGNLTWPNILIGIVLQRQKGMSNFLSHSAIVGGWEVAPHNTQTLTCDGGSSALVCVAACGQRLI